MSKARPSVSAPLTRKQLSRSARERRLRGYILIGTVVVAVIVLGLIGYGVLDQVVLQPRRPVARVGQAEISTASFQKAVRFHRYQLVSQYTRIAAFVGQDPQMQQFFGSQLQQLASELQNPTGLGQQVLNDLIDDQLIRQEAARRGITVSKDEVEARMGDSFNYYANGTPTPTITPSPLPTYVAPTLNPTTVAQWTPTPTLTPTATLTPTTTSTPGPTPTALATETPGPTATPFTADGYAAVVATTVKNLQTQASFNEADLRKFLESQVYREKVLQAVTADVTASEDQVHARHILISVSETATDAEKAAAKAKADEVLAKLKSGEDWDALAAQYSGDSSNARNGGDLGWFGKGQMVAEFETVAFATPVGQISDVVQTSFGYHVIQVLGHELRLLSSDQLDQKRQTEFNAWLQKQRDGTDADGKPTVEIFDRWQDHVPTTPDIPTGNP